LAAAALVAGALALGLWAVGSGRGGEPANAPRGPVEPVPAAESPAEEARNLAAWLRAHADADGNP
ncbi:MAG TPA: hypothetical protein VK915_08675, partial [Gaiellaceae bacterium]|nr:hypothetical protein [Gaiellaceae bacterium]